MNVAVERVVEECDFGTACLDHVAFFRSVFGDAVLRGKRHDVLTLSGFDPMVADPVAAQRLAQRMAQQLDGVLLE